ncbi:MAG: hypothetical protein ACRD44_18380 [Bryobacteraceae bacterium]
MMGRYAWIGLALVPVVLADPPFEQMRQGTVLVQVEFSVRDRDGREACAAPGRAAPGRAALGRNESCSAGGTTRELNSGDRFYVGVRDNTFEVRLEE